ncbi:hypothetical protein [Sediminibacterium ginsengisoli]|uniref:Uncharacterized protein n=1 Tax=Sediminibacterium ginsengisoli TaxID=413434 RepID=A0A1T4P2M4_9BACT|nr:hypothetical protein [Sediminibacterium ginsengisoli]SJZ85577.1 hypothetical protein SAMN04488132_105105 [Sediminibacterium ginsengisoli]
MSLQYYKDIKSAESKALRVLILSLSIVILSFLVIFGNDYIDTVQEYRIIYSAFIGGWISLSVSIFNANRVFKNAVEAELHSDQKDMLLIIILSCRRYLKKQVIWFNVGVSFFGIWLLLFLTLGMYK